MTGFILYCINFTRNNDFTNHDMSLLRNNPPSKIDDDNDDVLFLFV